MDTTPARHKNATGCCSASDGENCCGSNDRPAVPAPNENANGCCSGSGDESCCSGDEKHATHSRHENATVCSSAHTHDNCCGGSEPAMAESAEKAAASGRSFRVEGLCCAEEIGALRRAVGPAVGGEENLAFDPINARMTVLDDAGRVSDGAIMKAVKSTGMSATAWDSDRAEAAQAAHLGRQKLFAGLSGAFWLAGLVLHVVETGASGAVSLFSGHGADPVPPLEIALFLAAIAFGVRLVAPRAFSAARRLAPDMNLLMTIAVLGAIVLGEFFEGATVAFFFALSLALESWSVGRARNAVGALLDLAPETARIIRPDGSEADVPAAQVAVGDRFVVRGGDRIALDGEVIDGRGEVNQAPITGESAAVPKEPGDEVYAGTINGSGTLTVRATKPAGDTVLARIIRMVGEAHSRRAPVEQWVDRFARVYTPAVMVLAALIFVVPPLALGGAWGDWFYNALVLLVIACPCALVISTPVSIVSSLASSARQGVLVKGGAYIEAPSRLAALAMDKTGTITRGEPEVAGVYPLGGADIREVLSAAAALEARSSHPLASAILARAEAEGIPARAAEDVQIVPGRGVEGGVDGRAVWLGSDRFATERGLGSHLPAEIAERIERQGGTLVAVGDTDRLIGLIEIRDAIRPDARQVIADLHELGVRRIVMLTGDNRRTAEAVAREVGIDEIRSELLPEDKVAAVEALAAEHPMVAMIGDGVNDAPAMARAHFAIAMGAVGSDAAIETADIALMSDDIGKVPWLVRHSRRTMSIIRQNIIVSLAVKTAFVALTFGGLATIWGAIAADVGVSLLVVANALRLLRTKAEPLRPAMASRQQDAPAIQAVSVGE